ncbi:pyridoxamine 5'-phosphate oxidase family protein [Streptomyces tsukubensis]|uniref:Pyridoxamine 5'-phosphate oxidase n=1 Tax=Streptomyces tsukubensis TaxID=83656 RepID=A0A1V4A022_9ACTN|nr:pyridoxamine 5'-phosphate oxidase family protein [Streptomyces tsukubensis]OON72036.1 pyridoxamine 5'-phosphate oxidase [Streptomyces tsukubensis]QFR93254.1 pyridoxamine 5'-phosphate oxidase family protein [Streptomyces tsukubensis]
MTRTTPLTELDHRYSDPGATPAPWEEGVRLLEAAELYWLSTVREDGRPHVTPLIGVWRAGAMHFTTGPQERKARNLAQNPQVVLVTGTNALSQGCDIVVEGEAVAVTDEDTLRSLAEAYEAKYGKNWHFDVRDGAFYGQGDDRAEVYAVTPWKAFGFGKGEPFGQTRWSFA